MRTTLLMSAMAMALATSPCLAQSHADDAAAVATEAQPPPGRAEPEPGATRQKSAFGRVMAVLIAALVQESTQQSRSQETKASSATATSLPISIEVGEAFQPAAAVGTVATNGDAIRLSAASPDDSVASGVASKSVEPLALQAALQGDGK
jgi:hypothetical protein